MTELNGTEVEAAPKEEPSKKQKALLIVTNGAITIAVSSLTGFLAGLLQRQAEKLITGKSVGKK